MSNTEILILTLYLCTSESFSHFPVLLLNKNPLKLALKMIKFAKDLF
ncbi:hypothetical protein HMPREF9422_1134 [Streptococcus cristatus ATCC 51100]|nr:hypothetical protein HMPREF9422_1134 [Streptococcus cristatus ATCC 51100]